MGVFSWTCAHCKHSIISIADRGINEWMMDAVVLDKRGSRILGTYDGYGRLDELEIADLMCSGAVMAHQACWEVAGKPEFSHYEKNGLTSESAADLIRFILEELTYFSPDEGEPVIPWLWKPGSCPLVLVLGENAGGKSFFRRCVHAVGYKEFKLEDFIHLSMQGRATAGVGRVLIYGGSEDDSSTGAISMYVVKAGIKNCQKREEDHMMYWDEPDIGLSENAAAGAALEIVEFVKNLPERTKAVFVTTHSRVMVRYLLELNPHYIHLGSKEAPPTPEAWLERPIVPISTEEVDRLGHERWRAIQKILDGIKKKR